MALSSSSLEIMECQGLRGERDWHELGTALSRLVPISFRPAASSTKCEELVETVLQFFMLQGKFRNGEAMSM